MADAGRSRKTVGDNSQQHKGAKVVRRRGGKYDESSRHKIADAGRRSRKTVDDNSQQHQGAKVVRRRGGKDDESSRHEIADAGRRSSKTVGDKSTRKRRQVVRNGEDDDESSRHEKADGEKQDILIDSQEGNASVSTLWTNLISCSSFEKIQDILISAQCPALQKLPRVSFPTKEQ